MKLALYLPNFRDMVTVKELEDLTALAEELEFDSVWTLDRIVVPEASDRQELQPVRHDDGHPSRPTGVVGGPVVPGVPAAPLARREDDDAADRREHHQHALPLTRRARRGARHHRPPLGRPAQRRRRSGWMPEEFAAASAAHLFPRRHAHVRETLEIMQGIWTNDLFEYHGEFADFDRCGFGHKPLQKPYPPIYFSGLKDPRRSALRIAKYNLSGWIGIQDSPEEIGRWRTEIQQELDNLDTPRSMDNVDICSMIWFVITDEETDQTPNGKASNLLAGTAAQITDKLKRYQEAGMTMPLLWPPFQGVPVSKTLDDLKRLREEIMPKVDAG